MVSLEFRSSQDAMGNENVSVSGNLEHMGGTMALEDKSRTG